MDNQNPVTDISIILCTYNPDRGVLDRVLKHCLVQKTSLVYEIIVVDNNSSPVISLKPDRRIKIIRESTQGLANARLAGFKVCTAKNIVFVDDDNFIATDYLEQLSLLFSKYPDVGVWGPGIIELEYEGSPPEWIRKHFGSMFQEKTRKEIQFGKEASWPEYHPAGSGMAVSRPVFETYMRNYESGQITAAGRKANELSSGEDSQIVWTAVTMGKAAGTSPTLKLKHRIPNSRLSLGYLTRLQFNIARSYCQAMAEMFPDKKSSLKPLSFPGKLRLSLKVFRQSNFKPLLFYRKFLIEMAWFKGVKDWARNA